jgi:hypothetical protein
MTAIPTLPVLPPNGNRAPLMAKLVEETAAVLKRLG